MVFSRLHLYFPDFFQVWKIAGQILRLFLYEPCVIQEKARVRQ